MVQAVIFDMDGTLFDTEKMSIDIGHQILKEIGTPISQNAMLKTCGTNNSFIRNVLHQEAGPALDYDFYVKCLHKRIQEEIALHGIPKKPGLDKTLQWLSDNDYLMAVASSSDKEHILHYLKAANILSYFSVIIGGDMVPASKPAPDIFLAAANALNLPAQHCLAIEDSPNGIRSAAAAGCITIMIPDVIPANEELSSLSAAVLPSLCAIPPYLQAHHSLKNA